MAEVIEWTTPEPTTTDAYDTGQAYNLGRQFTLLDGETVEGVQWRVPDTLLTPPGGTHAAGLWDAGTSTRLAYVEISPTPGDFESFAFDPGDVYTASGDTQLIVSIYTYHYVFSSGADVGAETPSGSAVAGDSLLAAYNSDAATAPAPISTSGANFYISPVVTTVEDHTTTATHSVEVAVTGATSTERAAASTSATDVDLAGATATARSSAVAHAAELALAGVTATARATTAAFGASLSLSGATSTERASDTEHVVEVAIGEYEASGTAAPRLVSAGRAAPLAAAGSPARILSSVTVAR